MASRILYGSRASKPRPRPDDSAEKPSAIPKRSSISAVPAMTSRIPTHTSVLLTPKARNPEDRSTPASKSITSRAPSTERRPSETSLTSRDLRNAPSGIPKSMDTGMGVRTEISKTTPAPRNRLRRKPSSQDQRSQYARSETSRSSNDVMQRPAENESISSVHAYHDPFPGSILGISLPPVSSTIPALSGLPYVPTEYATSNSRMAAYIPKQPSPFSSNDLTPPTPNFAAQSSTASTRCSESPGPFSRTSTPTSASSHSPGIIQAPKSVTRTRPSVSPTRSRPPVTRRKVGASQTDDNESQGLSALRESVTSSSSSSTVKASESTEHANQYQRPKAPRFQGPAPTPPLRLSSKRIDGRQPIKEASTENKEQITQGRIPNPSPITSSQSQSQSKLPTLNNDRPKAPPQRPSREGTPVLPNARPTVVQSNLSHLATTGHKRRESAEKALLPASTKSEDGKLSRLRSPSLPSTTSRNPLQTPPAGIPRMTTPVQRSREPSRTREPQKPVVDSRIKLTKREPRPVETSPAKPSSRFGLFSRKQKSSTDASVHPAEKATKKGPAAGTGHEGYGKYARRGRSSSTSTVASRTSTERTSFSMVRPPTSRKSSFASSDGKPELDDFFRDRLEPVVIGGGGKIRENRNSGGAGVYQYDSGQSSLSSLDIKPTLPPKGRPSQVVMGSKTILTSPPSIARELLPPPHLEPQAIDPSGKPRSLAHRRSQNRLQLFGEAESVRIPPPINTKVLAPSPMLDTCDSTVSSVPQTDSTLITSDDLSEGHEGNWLKPKKKAQEKPKLNRKWNFFHRQHRSPERPTVERLDSFDSSKELPVAVANFKEPRTIAHYAMLDQFEHESEENLEDILRNIESNLTIETYDQNTSIALPKQEREPSMLLPSPPKFPAVFEESPRSASPRVPLNQVNTVQSQSPAKRAPRLQQVGRIPKVVSKRDRPHNPSPQSFSRPFTSRPSMDEEHPGLFALSEQPMGTAQTDPLPSLPWMEHYYDLSHASQGMIPMVTADPEFLAFSRKGSQVSGSSSSGALSLAPVTAITPLPEDILSGDEVWGEYDELLDHVTSTLSYEPLSPITPGYFDFPVKGGMKIRVPQIFNDHHTMSEASSEVTARASSPRYNKPPALPPRPDLLELPSPSNQTVSSFSLSDLYSNYANRSSAARSSIRHSVGSTVSGSRYSSQTIFSKGSRSSTDSSHTRRVTQVMAEKTNNISTDSLRFSALMTSRWLSFDRVLFSPVQGELRNNRQDRVLVLDGLENDDWSTYCALNYPDATVYNLFSTLYPAQKRCSEDSQNADGFVPPPNHRRISHASIAAPFPFPKGFFDAVVFRFPAANHPNAYRNAISECKRVLKPGGYLELSILDMDLINMGNRARRAVRGVKVRMQTTTPDFSLSPISDTVMKLLGRKGFENLNRCVVGVPVAGQVSDSRSSSMDDYISTQPTKIPDGVHTLSELLSGQSSRSNPHYPVTKMVARVGRWWWSQCYENCVIGSNDDSIWTDRQLLKECEKRETSFQLMVCYAQKPINARRRTVSV